MIETPPLRPFLDRDRPVVALGVALLATAVVLSAFYSRESGELDLSNFAVGLLATGGLLLFAVGTYLRLQQGDRSSDLVAWPGAFGSVGVGLMVAVAMDTHDATPYVAGLLVVLLSAARTGPDPPRAVRRHGGARPAGRLPAGHRRRRRHRRR